MSTKVTDKQTLSKMIKRLTNAERFFFLLLYAPSDDNCPTPVKGSTWLQKELFAISKNVPLVEEEADFDAYRYGSFSETIDEISDQFEISKYIQKDTNGSIYLTQKGDTLSAALWASTDIKNRELVCDIKKEFNDLTLNELLLYMYVTYPETSQNSDVRDRVLRDRRTLSLSLLRKGKVTIQKAAELAGMILEDFIELAKSTVRCP
jgi:predicted HTH domain antitoxin